MKQGIVAILISLYPDRRKPLRKYITDWFIGKIQYISNLEIAIGMSYHVNAYGEYSRNNLEIIKREDIRDTRFYNSMAEYKNDLENLKDIINNLDE